MYVFTPLFVLLLVGAGDFVSGQPCLFNDIDVKANFKPDEFVGVWYEYMIYDPANGTHIGIFNDVTETVDGLSIRVDWRRTVGGTCRTGTMNLDDIGINSVYKYAGTANTPQNQLLVLETDYTTYIVLFRCKGYDAVTDICSGASIFICTRDPLSIGPGNSESKLNAIFNSIKRETCKDRIDFVRVDQSDPCGGNK